MKTSKAVKTFLPKFTSDPIYMDKLIHALGQLQVKIDIECSQRADSLADTGMIGLAVHCKEKSQRIFNKVAGKNKSTEKFEDELWDNLAYAINLVVYWEMLKDAERSKNN